VRSLLGWTPFSTEMKHTHSIRAHSISVVEAPLAGIGANLRVRWVKRCGIIEGWR
jgi:hypothetical protein